MDEVLVVMTLKKIKKCKRGSCSGRLSVSSLIAQNYFKAGIVYEDEKTIRFPAKCCNKCGCQYIHIDTYMSLKKYRGQFNIINSELELNGMRHQRNYKLEQKRKKKNTFMRISSGVENKKFAGIQGYCIKCGAPEYRTGAHYCWECYKAEKTGY